MGENEEEEEEEEVLTWAVPAALQVCVGVLGWVDDEQVQQRALAAWVDHAFELGFVVEDGVESVDAGACDEGPGSGVVEDLLGRHEEAEAVLPGVDDGWFADNFLDRHRLYTTIS